MSRARREIMRWGVAGTFAAAAHAALAGALIVNWKSAAAMPGAAPPALMINLAAIEAPQVPKLDVAPGPDSPDVVEQKEATPPEKQIEKIEPLPPMPEKEKAVAVLEMPKPDPRPMVHESPPEKKADHAKKKEKRQVASRAAAMPTFDAQRSSLASAPAAGAAAVPSAAAATWRGALIAHLNRYKSYPAGASSVGTATVAFTINRSGQVVSARLTGSSGDRALDAEAVALPKRASPVPAPPESVGGGSIALNVPIKFSR